MNVIKNMEAFFVAALAVAAFTTYATADIGVPPTAAAPLAQAAAEPKMLTIVVTAKRLTVAEKARLDS